VAGGARECPVGRQPGIEKQPASKPHSNGCGLAGGVREEFLHAKRRRIDRLDGVLRLQARFAGTSGARRDAGGHEYGKKASRDGHPFGEHIAMVVILFRSKLTDVAGDDYGEMAAQMDAHARTFPGFIDVKAFKADDGERLTLVWWQDEETLRVWASDVRHREAQRMGRAKWYQYYKIDVAQVIRSNHYERKGESVASP
jgi:heme-degrading monooxygenase HmoA